MFFKEKYGNKSKIYSNLISIHLDRENVIYIMKNKKIKKTNNKS